MATFTREQRLFIVERLGRFVLPAAIIEEFCRTWQDNRLTCSLADIHALDPARGAVLDPDSLAKFTDAREHALANIEQYAPTKDKNARIIVLHQIIAEARATGDHKAALDALAKLKAEVDGAPPPNTLPPIGSVTREIVDPKPPE